MALALVFVPRHNVHDVLAFSYNKEAQGNLLIALGVAVMVSCIVQVWS